MTEGETNTKIARESKLTPPSFNYKLALAPNKIGISTNIFLQLFLKC